MRIKIDQDVCVGAGLCVLSSSTVFDQRDSDGVVVLRQEFPPHDLEDAVRNAARKCPSRAITVEDGQGDEVDR